MASPTIRHEYVGGYGHAVVVRGRDDLFHDNDADLQIFNANEVTSVPDNVGCCEVVAVGGEVANVRVGDIVFVDFYDVRQGVVLDCGERYIINDDALKAYFVPATGEIHPLPGYLITKAAPKRFTVALNGTDRLEVPAMILTQGIVGGRDSDGNVATHVLYEEVVKVGEPELNSTTRPLHRTEKALLDELARGTFPDDELKAFMTWRKSRPESEVKPGDLVPFCSELSVKVRVRGDYVHIVKQASVLGVIDDGLMLDDAIREGNAGAITNVGGRIVL